MSGTRKNRWKKDTLAHPDSAYYLVGFPLPPYNHTLAALFLIMLEAEYSGRLLSLSIDFA